MIPLCLLAGNFSTVVVNHSNACHVRKHCKVAFGLQSQSPFIVKCVSFLSCLKFAFVGQILCIQRGSFLMLDFEMLNVLNCVLL